MNTMRMAIAATLMLVLVAPLASAGQYHYTQTVTSGRTLLGGVTIYVGGVPLYTMPSDTIGKQTEFIMESDADCVVKHNTRSTEETLTGEVSGSKPQSALAMAWEWAGLSFLADRGDTISFAGTVTGNIHVDTGESEFVGTTALEALQQILQESSRSDADIHDAILLAAIADDIEDGETAYAAEDIGGKFEGYGPGVRHVADDIDWTC